MSNQHPDYTEDDFTIVNLGYWDPGIEDDEPAAESVRVDPPAAEAESGQPDEIAQSPADAQAEQTSPVQDSANPWVDEWEEPRSEFAGEADLARVELMPGGVKAAIEAILSVAQTPLSVRELSATLIVSEPTVEAALDQLHREYRGYDDGQTVHEPRGMELRRVAGGWRIYARADFAPWVGRHVKTQESTKLPKSALETLSVIAYQQPISKGQVSAIRGANSESSFRTLLLHGLITETSPDEDGVAQFATTPVFLEKMGLNSLAELPPLAPYLPDIEDLPLLTEQP